MHTIAGESLPIRALIVTVSDTRDGQTDRSGPVLRARLEAANITVARAVIVHDEPAEILAVVQRALHPADPAAAVDLIVLTGGTGITSRDITIETIEPLLHKKLDGFGEAFRRLSWDQVGAKSVLSRALAGTHHRTLIVALPGSPKAVELAIDAVLAPFVAHAIALLRK
ncbi:MAG: MogA/MoaB family molybdenum cofactor biosynthesis protein [Deltaproteobacteria bacterium]|nr:MogA/MoaB family molybdenum cofactor biosynthesis protein [Deltaproteobacteria bacterium]